MRLSLKYYVTVGGVRALLSLTLKEIIELFGGRPAPYTGIKGISGT